MGKKEDMGLCRPDEGTTVEELEGRRFQQYLGGNPAGPWHTQMRRKSQGTPLAS